MKITRFLESTWYIFDHIVFRPTFRVALISILIFPYISPTENFFYYFFSYKGILSTIVIGFSYALDQEFYTRAKLVSSIINATLIYLVFCQLRNSFVDRFYDVSNGIQGQIKFEKQKLLIYATWYEAQQCIIKINNLIEKC